MPVPVPNPETQEPRRLLRDVVYDKLFEAIIDGTLELGERLNDDELVRWLGVSRTPVREAIAKLAEQGLVDIEANRYTRVVSPTFTEFVDAIQTGYDIWGLIMARGVPHLEGELRTTVLRALEERAETFESGKGEDLVGFESIAAVTLEASGSASLERLRLITGPLAVLLFRRASTAVEAPRSQTAELARALHTAVTEGDARRAAELVTNEPSNYADFYAAVRQNGIFGS